MSENDEIALELQKEEQRKAALNIKPIKIQRAQVSASKLIWTFGAVALDVASAYAIWQILYWWYAILWILAGAGGLVYSEWLKVRVGNNHEQREIGERGVTVSAVLVGIMAFVSGFALVFGLTKNAWIEVFTLLSVVGLAGYHLLQSYRYDRADDEWIEQTNEAREVEKHEKEMRGIYRAARRVEAKKQERGVKATYAKEHGAALEAAMGVPGGRRTDDQNARSIYSPPKSTPNKAVSTQEGQSNPSQSQNAQEGDALQRLLSALGMSRGEVQSWMKQRDLRGETETRDALRQELGADFSNNHFKKAWKKLDPNPHSAERVNGRNS